MADAAQYSKLDVVKPDEKDGEDVENKDTDIQTDVENGGVKTSQTGVDTSTDTGDEGADPIEEKARSQGWRPQEEWEGDPSEWVDAKEFVFRGELMDRIKQQSSKLTEFSKENKEIKDALRILGEHNKKIAEQEYKKALADLKKQKVTAREDGDYDTEIEIEDRIEELKTSKKELEDESDNAVKVDKEGNEDTQDENQIPPVVNDWLQNESNKWYHSDPVMRGAADSVYVQHLQFNPEDFAGALKKVEETMKAYFPEKFGKTKKTGAAVTEPSNRNTARKKGNQNSKKATVSDLSDEQKHVAQTFVDTGVFSNVQEYVDQLVELGEL